MAPKSNALFLSIAEADSASAIDTAHDSLQGSATSSDADLTRPPSSSSSASASAGGAATGKNAKADPFATPPPSLPGSSANLSSLAGPTASRLSILNGPNYSFSALANGMGPGSKRTPALTQNAIGAAATPSAATVTFALDNNVEFPATGGGGASLSRVSTAGSIAAYPASGVPAGAPPVPPIPSRFSLQHAHTPSDLSGGSGSGSGSGLGLSTAPGVRESFASPPPMRMSLPGTTTPARRPTSSNLPEKPLTTTSLLGLGLNASLRGSSHHSSRMKSSALPEDADIPKPWLTAKNGRARIAYWLTLGVAMLGVAASFVRIFFGAKGVQLIKGNLCLMLEDEFESDEIDSSKWGWEVDMSGYGRVLCLSIVWCSVFGVAAWRWGQRTRGLQAARQRVDRPGWRPDRDRCFVFSIEPSPSNQTAKSSFPTACKENKTKRKEKKTTRTTTHSSYSASIALITRIY